MEIQSRRARPEAVDALIEAGQEEGIIQEGDRDLIQSVVEFGGKSVREAMKPRPEMVAVPVNTTVEQFINLLKGKPFSRVPVYEGTIHNIKGVVWAQDVLQVPDSEAAYRTVVKLMRKDVYFVPESKLSSDLLRENKPRIPKTRATISSGNCLLKTLTATDQLANINTHSNREPS